MDHCVVVGKSWLLLASSYSIERKRKREKIRKNSGTHALIIRQLFEKKKRFSLVVEAVLFGLGNSIRSSFFCLAMGAQSSMTFLYIRRNTTGKLLYLRQITMMQLSSKLYMFFK